MGWKTKPDFEFTAKGAEIENVPGTSVISAPLAVNSKSGLVFQPIQSATSEEIMPEITELPVPLRGLKTAVKGSDGASNPCGFINRV